ncbi:MAG TPA: hypothetical protein VIC59_05520 [Gemmatimonadota bacterium]|jgi:hypothetical protein
MQLGSYRWPLAALLAVLIVVVVAYLNRLGPSIHRLPGLMTVHGFVCIQDGKPVANAQVRVEKTADQHLLLVASTQQDGLWTATVPSDTAYQARVIAPATLVFVPALRPLLRTTSFWACRAGSCAADLGSRLPPATCTP